MALFGPDRLSEEVVAPATRGNGLGQRIRVGVVERDNGLVMAKTSQISNALYDLADQNSTTHTVVLPHGTTVKLVAAVSNNVGSWRARFEISNPKLAKTVEEKGASAAAELAGQIDLLALNKIDKNALAKVTEAHDAGDHNGMLVALGLREAPLEEIDVHVSGYVTKSGKHVGAYSQIRKAINGIKPGTMLHFPDGISVKRGRSGGYVVGGSKAPQLGGVHKPSAKAAADDVARKSAGSTDSKSIGGRVAHSIDKGADVNSIPNSGDNPKLPGAPHPADVADRAAKVREGTKLPSRKERGANERKAKQDKEERRAAASDDAKGEYDSVASRIERLKDARRSTKAMMDGLRKRGGKRKDLKEYQDQLDSYDKELKSLRGDKEDLRALDKSPMPGVIRKPSESDEIRRKEGERSLFLRSSKPSRGAHTGGARGGAVDDPKGTKLRGASNDPAEFADEIKMWSEGVLRREAKLLPNSSPLYKLLIAELRRKTTG